MQNAVDNQKEAGDHAEAAAVKQRQDCPGRPYDRCSSHAGTSPGSLRLPTLSLRKERVVEGRGGVRSLLRFFPLCRPKVVGHVGEGGVGKPERGVVGEA